MADNSEMPNDATDADQPAAEGGPNRPPATVASVLGEIAWLMAMTPSPRHFFLADLEWLVMAPITKQQFRVYRDENGRPVGLVLWAKLSEEAESRMLDGTTRIRPQDWDSGNRHWIVDIIDVTGGQRAQTMIDDMKKAVFQETPFKYHRIDASGAREVVSTDSG